MILKKVFILSFNSYMYLAIKDLVCPSYACEHNFWDLKKIKNIKLGSEFILDAKTMPFNDAVLTRMENLKKKCTLNILLDRLSISSLILLGFDFSGVNFIEYIDDKLCSTNVQFNKLTNSEVEIFRLLRVYNDLKLISLVTNKSIKTISTQKNAGMKKLRIYNNAELAFVISRVSLSTRF
ncbi:helix-turn-helix transcriptional regulator [Serratia marcescens]|uniref:helix-turn-helix transcriptional regulator n=1 Tax=Serratia marcescens TaxID=615 RepID=UPI001461435F|nr:response regulator transcription factor [Serratia marcescens]MBH2706757.1 response regulator transcription factor [Serratia marcescens]MBH3191430.1 response regulator transcription factor [Serratia marcescens]MBN5254073.1 response regulator transcription factor [Serratia marcescens]NMQ39727.1 response regulator transcription factor [Serratia marcescens]